MLKHDVASDNITDIYLYFSDFVTDITTKHIEILKSLKEAASCPNHKPEIAHSIDYHEGRLGQAGPANNAAGEGQHRP